MIGKVNNELEQMWNEEIMAKYRVIPNDCWGFNNSSYTVHLR
jgi:hypothetical protein